MAYVCLTRPALGVCAAVGSLVRHRVLKVAVLLTTSVLLASVLGPALGAVVLFTTDAPFPVVNVIAGIAFVMPCIALTMIYAYLDARIHAEMVPETPEPSVLPAELEPDPALAPSAKAGD